MIIWKKKKKKFKNPNEYITHVIFLAILIIVVFEKKKTF